MTSAVAPRTAGVGIMLLRRVRRRVPGLAWRGAIEGPFAERLPRALSVSDLMVGTSARRFGAGRGTDRPPFGEQDSETISDRRGNENRVHGVCWVAHALRRSAPVMPGQYHSSHRLDCPWMNFHARRGSSCDAEANRGGKARSGRP